MNFSGAFDSIKFIAKDVLPTGLSLEKAKEFATEAIAEFNKEENKKNIQETVKNTTGGAAEKARALQPIVEKIMDPILTKFGFPNGLSGITQAMTNISLQATKNESLQKKLEELKAKIGGN